jgi:hypothetical protein
MKEIFLSNYINNTALFLLLSTSLFNRIKSNSIIMMVVVSPIDDDHDHVLLCSLSYITIVRMHSHSQGRSVITVVVGQHF